MGVIVRNPCIITTDHTGNPTPHTLKPARDWDRSGRRFGDTQKSARELGFRARIGLNEGLAHTVAWTRAHRELILSAMLQHRRFVAGIDVYADSDQRGR